MAKQFDALNDALIEFIQQQKIYFVATATQDSRVNVSPKGMDSLIVISNNQVAWLNVTGSGNETSPHIQQQPRMTIMFNAFEGPPMILRLYGTAKVVHRKDPEWDVLYPLFTPLPAARQIFVLDIDLVQTSCGMAVPFFDYVGEREKLNEVHTKLGQEGVEQYWINRNHTSLDGVPTHIVEKNISESSNKT